MYCGSCMRDNRLAATLIAQGRDVVLIPLYTPLRTDEVDVSRTPIYFGGISVFLNQSVGLFRRLPRWLTGALDAPGLLRRAVKFSGDTSVATLGALTVSILRGANGPQRRELDRLIDGLREMKPDLINLPQLMFVGAVRRLKEALGVPVLCTLGGEDIFLDALTEPYRSQAFELIDKGARDVDGFISTTEYYADHAAAHFQLPRDRISVVPLGVHVEDFADGPTPPPTPLTIGYFARICQPKGLLGLCEALVQLRAAGRDCRVRAAGYVGPDDRAYLERVRAYVRENGLESRFECLGEVDRAGKIEFLKSLHAFCVPTVYHEAKGTYLIEALAAGLPVVQPRHGSFPEIIEATGGGLLYDPGSTEELAKAIMRLMDDPSLRRTLGEKGRAAVRESFTDRAMADKTWAIYESYCARR